MVVHLLVCLCVCVCVCVCLSESDSMPAVCAALPSYDWISSASAIFVLTSVRGGSVGGAWLAASPSPYS